MPSASHHNSTQRTTMRTPAAAAVTGPTYAMRKARDSDSDSGTVCTACAACVMIMAGFAGLILMVYYGVQSIKQWQGDRATNSEEESDLVKGTCMIVFMVAGFFAGVLAVFLVGFIGVMLARMCVGKKDRTVYAEV